MKIKDLDIEGIMLEHTQVLGGIPLATGLATIKITDIAELIEKKVEQYANEKVEKIIQEIEYDDYDTVDDVLSFLRSQSK